MDFAFSDEQEALRASARDYLADRFPLDRVVSLADSDAGWDPATWKELAGLGWLDEELGVLEHAVLAEETGFGLLPAPLFATIGLAWPLLLRRKLLRLVTPSQIRYAAPQNRSTS